MRMSPLGLLMAGVVAASTAAVLAQATAPVTPDSLLIVATRAAGQDHTGTFIRICVAPENLAAGGRGSRGGPNSGTAAVPDRATWYAAPYKVFDNLYFLGTRIH